MPSRNTVKIYAEDGYYHLYNRGVEKRNIFLDEQDCGVFLRLFKQYLSPKEDLSMMMDTGLRLERLMKSNMHGEIELLVFALMPNHFHLLVKQITGRGIATFMMRFLTSYVLYFNKKYERVGPLFQDTYKGVMILDDSYLLHLSKYIHLNPFKLGRTQIDFKKFSSYAYFIEEKHARWLKPEFILAYFSSQEGLYSGSYRDFVENYKGKISSENILGDLILEDED